VLPKGFARAQRFSKVVSAHCSRRRDGRVAEGARLESVFTRKGNVGSNPTLSASFLSTSYKQVFLAACNGVQRAYNAAWP
jgi:hypothetical protein